MHAVAFPLSDPIGPAGAPLPPADVAFIAERIAAHAGELERGVPRSLLLDLGQQGLFGAPHRQHAELAELLAGSSADTWFCWAQHATPLRTLQAATGPCSDALREQWLTELEAGRCIAAVSFAHLRRAENANPGAKPTAGGWVLNGTLDWITSWDIADVLLLMARHGDDVVQFLIPIDGEPPQGFDVGPVLDLVAMRGTHTRAATLHEVFLPSSMVLDQVPFTEWERADSMKTMSPNPAVFGLIRSAVSHLDQCAHDRDDGLLRALVESLVDEAKAIRDRAYAGSAGVDVRAQSLQLALRASTAVITALSGKAMATGSDAERRVRAALFMQVQAQTTASRNASLQLMLNESVRPGG